MNIDNLTEQELRDEIELRGGKVHHKAGLTTLKTTLMSLDKAFTSEEKTEVKEEKKKTTKKEVKRIKQPMTKGELAMSLIRIVVVPNDTAQTSHPGHIFTVLIPGVNGGRAIKKFVPFN